MSDELLDVFCEAMMKPLPEPGQRVTVNGRAGTLLSLEMPYTCASYYRVLFDDGEEIVYMVSDFGPMMGESNPVIEMSEP